MWIGGRLFCRSEAEPERAEQITVASGPGCVKTARRSRMGKFVTGSAACEAALWPAGTFARAYEANRRAAVESMIDGDPVASSVREIMAQRKTWIGTAADLLCFGAEYSGGAIPRHSTGWPKNPRALAGRLRRVQTPLRAVGIEIGFRREGRAGTRASSR